MEIATIITALAALVTGLASFVIILEMKKQRTAISRPVLKLLSKYCEARYSREGHWGWEGQKLCRPELNLLNFGTGPAINILVEWNLDEEQLISSLKHFDPYNQMTIKREGNSFHLDNSFHMMEKQKNHKIAAIPVYASSDNTSLNIPTYYVGGFEKFTQLAFIDSLKDEKKEISGSAVPEFPPINAIIYYEDINGNKLKQVFKVQLQISFVESKAEDGTGNIGAVFEVSEEKN